MPRSPCRGRDPKRLGGARPHRQGAAAHPPPEPRRVAGGAVLAALLCRSPRTKVILLTTRTTEARILDTLSRGAWGYLEQEMLRTFLPKAVRAVDAGEVWVPRKMVGRILDRLASLTAQK